MSSYLAVTWEIFSVPEEDLRIIGAENLRRSIDVVKTSLLFTSLGWGIVATFEFYVYLILDSLLHENVASILEVRLWLLDFSSILSVQTFFCEKFPNFFGQKYPNFLFWGDVGTMRHFDPHFCNLKILWTSKWCKYGLIQTNTSTLSIRCLYN